MAMNTCLPSPREQACRESLTNPSKIFVSHGDFLCASTVNPQHRNRVVIALGLALAFAVASVQAYGQRGVNCDTTCGGGPVDSRASITNARGMGSLISPGIRVGKTKIIEGSQSFSYAVPLFAVPGRNGLNLNLTLYYNSAIWNASSTNAFTLNSDLDNPSLGFRLDFGFIDSNVQLLVDPDGSTHLLSPASTAFQVITTDSTFTQVTESNAVGASPLSAILKDGRQVTYTVVNNIYRPTQIEDTNGNLITINYLNDGSSTTLSHLSISSITDTTGRAINFFYDSTRTMLQCVTTASQCGIPNTETYSFTWNNGTSNPYVLNFNFNSLEVSMVKSDNSFGPSIITSGTQALNILTGVQRPDGTSVTFSYGDWGVVNEIQEFSSSRKLRYSASYNYPPASAGALSHPPTFTQETIFDGVNTGTWNYQATVGSTTNVSNMVTQFQVTDPCGTTTTTNFSTAGNALDGLPTTTKITSAPPASPASNCPTVPTQTWRSLIKSWTTDSLGNPLLASTTTTLDDNSQSQTVFKSYDANGNPTDVLEYDIGSPVNGAPMPGSLMEETVISYAALGNHILNRPSDVQIKDGKGNLISHNKLNYDEVATTGFSPLPPMHDETNYAPSSTTARGNLTSSVVYTNAAASTGVINSNFTYDEFGNLIASSMGCCTQQKRHFSSITAYAYPDSVVVGPSGSQLTTSYTYNFGTGANFGFGTIATVTDTNGQTTTFGYDIDNRLISTKTPDGVTASTSYDDSSANPSVTGTNTANSLAAKSTFDGRGRTLSTQVENGSSPVSTTTFAYNILGEMLQASNPFGPSDSIVYATYGYDALGRVIQTIPPAVSGTSSQNPYQVSYSGATATMTDPAGKQRKQYKDALGRLLRVDEPGLINGQTATGSVTISGTEQSVPTSSGNGATAGTANVVIAGTERSTQVLTHAATNASIAVTLSGSVAKDSIQTCTRTGCTTHTFNDTGTVQFSLTVGGTTIGPVTTSYGASTPASLASALYTYYVNNFGSNSVVTMSNPNGGASFTLTTTAASMVANASTVSASVTSNCVSSDTTSCGGPGFSISPTQANFTGGSDNVFTTMQDTGTVTVGITVNGTLYSKTSNYGANSTPGSIAGDLFNQINGDSTLSKLIIAGLSGSTLQLTTTTTGASTNDPLSTSAATNSQYFSSGSTSFTATPSGSTFTPGQNGTLFDSGTIKATLTGFGENPVSESVTFGQGSTPASIATGLAAAFHNDPYAPVDANTSSGSAVVNFTARSEGADANNYSISIAEQSASLSNFPTPSFPTVSIHLSGGATGTPSLDPTVALITTYSYDPLGDLLQVNQGQQTRTYQYDNLGRVISSTIPETGYQAASASYTDFGALSQSVDPRVAPGTSTHLTTTINYDFLNRPQSITYSDGTPTVTYIYNPPGSANNTGGRLIKVTNGVASETYQYDIMGRITVCQKTIAGQTYITSYAYNPDGTPSSITYPSGRTVNFAEDAIGRLTQIGTNGVSLLSIGSYNGAGEVLTETYGNGVSGTYTYNNQLQLATLQYTGTSPILNLAYNYGSAADNGQIQSVTDALVSSRSTSYTYDELGRLKAAQTNDQTSPNTWSLKYMYDRYGNRLSETPVGGTASMSMNEVLVDSTTNHITSAGYAYDNAGNMTSDGIFNYSYNIMNEMNSVTPVGSGATTASFSYDANGLRVIKNNTVYIYSGSKVIAEYASGAAASSPTTEHVYKGQLRLVTITGGVSTFHYADHLSVRADTDINGNVVHTYGHYPFGVTWYETGTPDKWKFASYENDNESGLNYAQARFQSPRVGRFNSLDLLPGSTSNPQSLNHYAYVTNDPINLTDPIGMAGGRWDCLLDDHGDCVGGNGYDPGGGGWGDAQLDMHDTGPVFGDPFGPLIDPTQINPLAEAEAEFNHNEAVALYQAQSGCQPEPLTSGCGSGGPSGGSDGGSSGGSEVIPDITVTVDCYSNGPGWDCWWSPNNDIKILSPFGVVHVGDIPVGRIGQTVIPAVGQQTGQTTKLFNCIVLGAVSPIPGVASAAGAPSYPGLWGTALYKWGLGKAGSEWPALNPFFTTVAEYVVPPLLVANGAAITSQCYADSNN